MPIDPFRGPPTLQEWQRQLIGMIPYVGPAYNALRGGNAIVKMFQGMTGNLPANQALPGSDPDYGNPNYIGLGDPVSPANPSAPAPTSATAPPPRIGPGAIRDWRNVYNTGRFTNAPPFSQTVAQAMFPGSAIGPFGGGNTNPYTGQIVHPSGGTEMSPIANAFSQYVNSRNIK